MKQIFKSRVNNAGVPRTERLVLSAQDWYHVTAKHASTARNGGAMCSNTFVGVDLDHIGSAIWASGKERHRLERTKQELAELQGKLEHGRYDEPELNDVIDSMRKVSR